MGRLHELAMHQPVTDVASSWTSVHKQGGLVKLGYAYAAAVLLNLNIGTTCRSD